MTAASPNGEAAAVGGVGTIVMGLGMMIGLPLMYGLMGFIMGAVGALVYNGLAGVVGGVKFELEGVQHEYAPPPPPHQWAPNQYPEQ